MKNQMYPKLLLLAILSTMFIFISFRKAENSRQSGTSGVGKVENTAAVHRYNESAKTSGAHFELDYWIRWKNQFVWTSGRNGSTLLPNNPGC